MDAILPNRGFYKLGFILLALLPMLGAFNAPFLMSYDDIWFIAENPLIKSGLGGLSKTFTHDTEYTPISFISLYMDHLIFGNFTGGFRFVSAMIHGLNAILIFSIARKIVGNAEAALIAALLFTLHPTTVESVAWVNQRRGLLGAFFGLLALWIYLKDPATGTSENEFGPGARRVAAAWFCLALAQLSKKSAVSYGLIFCALELFYFSGPKLRRACRAVLMLIPCLLSGLGALTSSVEHLVPPPGGESLIGRVIGTLHLHGRSWGLFFWPFDLSAFYYVAPVPAFDAAAASALAVPALFLALYRWLGLSLPRCIFLLVWTVAGLAPSMNPFRGIAFTLQDRYLYVSLPAMALLLAEVLVALSKRSLPSLHPRAAWVAAGVLCLVCGIASVTRSAVWRSEISVFSDAIARQPHSAFGHAYLATYLFHVYKPPNPEDRLKVLARSLAAHEAALKCDDYERMVYPMHVMVEHATLRLNSGNLAGANELFERIINGRPERAIERGAKRTLVHTFADHAVRKGDFARALHYVESGLKVMPDDATFLQNRVMLLIDSKKTDEARTEARRLLSRPELKPAMTEILKRLE